VPVLEAFDIERQRVSLLNRIIGSPQFLQAASLQRILRFLFERAGQENAPSVTEYEIAVTVIQRPPLFDPKVDSIVRVSIASIRQRLQAYFENEGRNERWSVEIPKGEYRLRFAERSSSERNDEPGPEGLALRRFWDPYLTNANANVLCFTELLCFRDAEGNFFRNLYTNDLAEAKRDMGRRIPDGLKDPIPTFHFVSGGEVQALVSLIQGFHAMHAPLEVKNSRLTRWVDIQNSNLVVVGCSRANAFTRNLQCGEKLQVREQHIEDCDPPEGAPSRYECSRFLCGSFERVTDYALITRRRGPADGTCVTLIGANHGRAHEGAAEFLFREDKVRELLDLIAPGGQSPVPEHFQVLLRIEMVDFNEEVVDVQYVTHKL
jgi:hypothetical protein